MLLKIGGASQRPQQMPAVLAKALWPKRIIVCGEDVVEDDVASTFGHATALQLSDVPSVCVRAVKARGMNSFKIVVGDTPDYIAAMAQRQIAPIAAIRGLEEMVRRRTTAEVMVA